MAFLLRALDALAYLVNRAEKTLAVVTHGNLKRALLGVLLIGKKMTFSEWTRIRDSFATSNTAVTVLSCRDGAWLRRHLERHRASGRVAS